MADRSIVVRLQAVISDFQAKMAQAGKAVDAVADKVEKQRDSIDKLGGMSLKAGLAVGAGVALVTKAAIDWESAWAGVTKTVDGSTEELGKLEGQLRGMAKTMPATHSDIAAVAEAAGQLGVATKDVASFTKTMIDLGETTNLSADEAATSLAQFMNIMGTAPENVSRLGSAVVDLGNKGASTERDIVQMGQRIAAAGKSVGMSETAVLAYASALSSAGVEAEAGGTAISMSFKQIDAAVRTGGKGLDTIAKTAGVSSAAFQKAWKEDAAGAMNLFVEGLGKLSKAGGDANGILDSLGMTGMRQSDSIMRLAQAQGLLRINLDNSTKAWDENIALTIEAEKRYGTTESKVRIAWNNITDAAIDAGAVMLPAVAGIARGITGITEAYQSLPEGAKQFITAGAAVSAGALITVGGIAKVVTVASEAREAIKNLGGSFKVFSLSAGAIGAVIGIAALAWSDYATKQAESKSRIEQFTDAIKDQTDAVNANSQALMIKFLKDQGAYDAAQKLGIAYGDVTKAAFGNAEAQSKVTERLQEMQAEAVAAAAEGRSYEFSLQDLTSIQGVLTGSIGGTNAEFEKAKEGAKQTSEANAALEDSSMNVAMSQKKLAEETKKSTDELIRAANAALQLSGSQMGLESAIDDATKSAKENGKTLDISTEKGRANQATLDALARAALALRDSQVQANASTQEIDASTVKARQAFIASATQMGLNAAQANALADKYNLIPTSVATAITTPGVKISQTEADTLNAKIRNLPPETKVAIVTKANAEGYEAAMKMAEQANKTTATVKIYSVLVNRAVADGGLFEGSGMVQSFADGGFPTIGSQQPQIRRAGGAGIRWAEDGAGPWEGFVSGHPSKRARSRTITEIIVQRLGGTVEWQAANGAVINYAPTARDPISALAAMGRPLDLSPASINALASVLLAASNASVSSAARASAFVGRPA